MMLHKKILIFTRKELFLHYFAITLGAMIFAAAIVVFLVPYKIAPGGVSGLAVIINNITGFPTGVAMLCFNIPIFFLGLKLLGFAFSAKSLYATFVSAFFTDFFQEVLHLGLKISDPILAPLFGGVALGIGLGLIIKVGGGTCGSGTIALIVSKYTNLKQGKAIILINSLVVVAAGYIFKSADLALYGFLSMYTSSVIIDMIVEGFEYAMSVHIISDKALEIADVIMQEMDRGVTSIKGRGLFTREDKNILFIVIAKKEIHEIKAIVKKLDPDAFVIVNSVHEVLGHGFRKRI